MALKSLTILFLSQLFAAKSTCKIGTLDLTSIENDIINCSFVTDFNWTLSYSPCQNSLPCHWDYWNSKYEIVEYRDDGACFYLANTSDIPVTNKIEMNGTTGYQLQYNNGYDGLIADINFLCDPKANSSVQYTTCGLNTTSDTYHFNIFGNLTCSPISSCLLKQGNYSMNLQQFNTTIINATYKYNNNNYEIDYKPCGPELTCFDTQTKTNISTNALTINQKDNSCSNVLGYVYGANTQVNLAYSKNLNEWQIEYNNPKGCFDINGANTKSTFIAYWKCNANITTYSVISSAFVAPCFWKMEIESIEACGRPPVCNFKASNTNHTLNIAVLNNATLVGVYNSNNAIEYTPCITTTLNCEQYEALDVFAIDINTQSKTCDNLLGADMTVVNTIEYLDNSVRTWEVNYNTKGGCNKGFDAEFIVKYVCNQQTKPYKVVSSNFNAPCLWTMVVETAYAC
eukprot:72398_1